MLGKGYTFTHDRFRQQIPGVKVAASPYKQMVVTKVTPYSVYYAEVGDTKGRWVMDRNDFTRKFGV